MKGFRYRALRDLLSHKRWQRSTALTIMMLFTLATLSSCFSLLQSTPPEDATQSSPYSGAVEFSCNQACAARGQCGTAADQADRVFMSTSAPVVDNHDQLVAAGAKGLIINTVTQTLVTASTQQQFNQPFHLVQVDGGLAGWVAEWCVIPAN